VRLALALSLVLTLAACSDDTKAKDASVDHAAPDSSQLEAGAEAGKPDVKPDAKKADLSVDAAPLTEWKQLPVAQSDTIYGIWGDSASNIYLVGKDGGIVHYDGKAWIKQANPEKSDLYAAWGKSATEVYAGGEGMVVYWNGTQWAKAYDSTSYHFRKLWSAPGSSNVWAVGEMNGYIYYKSGSTPTSYWSSVSFYGKTAASMYGIWGVSASEIYVVGDGGLIMKCAGTCTSSSAWTIMASGTTSNLRDIWGVNSGDLYAVGLDGTILHYDGTKWSVADGTSGLTSYWYGIWGSGPKDIYVVGNSIFKPDETIVHYDGTSWTKMSAPKLPLSGVWGSSDKDVYAIAPGAVLHYAGKP